MVALRPWGRGSRRERAPSPGKMMPRTTSLQAPAPSPQVGTRKFLPETSLADTHTRSPAPPTPPGLRPPPPPLGTGAVMAIPGRPCPGKKSSCGFLDLAPDGERDQVEPARIRFFPGSPRAVDRGGYRNRGRGPGRGLVPPRANDTRKILSGTPHPSRASRSSPALGGGGSACDSQWKAVSGGDADAVFPEGWGRASPGLGLPPDISPDCGPWWISQSGEGAGEGARPLPGQNDTRKILSGTPHPALVGAGAVRGDTRWKAVPGSGIDAGFPKG
jgi:hypothetical protein